MRLLKLLINNAERIIVIAIISFIFFGANGGSFTFAKPEYVLGIPFEGKTVTIAGQPTVSLSVIREVREVSATYEHHTVATALQLMRVTEGVKEVPVVTVSTNDMGSFPSSKHSLYPNYLAKRFSLFKYIVNSEGIVSIDAPAATTEAQLEKIEKWLERLEKDR
ncbi:MAG: hypothetical protein ACE5KP_01215 [Dehalococcoidales bacterium]